jgi:hypothetical protein
MLKEYYNIKPFDFEYYSIGDVFSKIENNAFITFIVLGGSNEIYIDMTIRNASHFKDIYIKEISYKINNTTIPLLKNKNYRIDHTHITLGKIDELDIKNMLKNIGKNKLDLLVIQEYILDNRDLIHEEYIYTFEYKKKWHFFKVTPG